MKDYTDIIYSPVITEKSAYAAEKGVYTFKVAGSANKVEIKKAIEKAFDVKLEDNTAFLPGVVSRKKQVVPRIDCFIG